MELSEREKAICLCGIRYLQYYLYPSYRGATGWQLDVYKSYMTERHQPLPLGHEFDDLCVKIEGKR